MTKDLSKKDNNIEEQIEKNEILEESMQEDSISVDEILMDADLVAKDQEIAALKEANQDAQSKLLRSLADLENYRRRAEKNLEESNKYAIASFAKDIISVADNLDRALQSVAVLEDIKLVEDFIKGIEMTRRELNSVFEKHSISSINPKIGDIFDHNEHQAVAHIDIPDVKSGSVSSVMQVGYKVHDRLLRPAMVSVAK